MKRAILVFVLAIGVVSLVFAWGAWGHQHINRAAVFGLPDEMRPFFYNHIDFITEEAVVPDLRKYTIGDKAEFPRHYINMESYDPQAMSVNLPLTMKEARAKYPDSLLNKAGILPWYIQEMMDKLTRAFKERRKTEILFIAADLGHYIGDAHMPLHTALNHDGQLTGQKGIHAFWEGQLPESFGEGYNLCTGPARYIDDIVHETWRIIDSSHTLAERLLEIDKELSASMPKTRIYRTDSTGKTVVNQYNDPVHSAEYAKLYHERLHGMIEQQLRGAVAETANFWYTAWVNAGKPDLADLDPQELTDRNKDHLAADLEKWRQGKVGMVRPTGEFTPWAGR
jgi:hypothetical protein